MELEQGSLAYVFWHWPRPGTGTDAYERGLTAFQERLRGSGAPGLRAAVSFRLGQAPWAQAVAAPPPPPVYEDWYVVGGFAALEDLNTAAVSAELQPAHDRAAAAAGGGTAGLYALRRVGAAPAAGGQPTTLGGRARTLTGRPIAHWLSKPAGLSYKRLEELLAEATPAAALWQRQLTLGPGAEFCLTAPTPVTLPPELTSQIVPREPLP